MELGQKTSETVLNVENGEPPEEAQQHEDRDSLDFVFLASPLRSAVCAAITAALIAVAAVRYEDISHILIVSVYLAVLVACAASDMASFRVPNVITYPATLFAILVGTFLPDSDFRSMIGGGLAAGGFMLFALVVSRGAMGLGDVKLATFGGFALGWPLIAPAMVLMALLGGLAALLLLLLRVKSRKDPIPYAPFISGAVSALILWQGTVFAEL